MFFERSQGPRAQRGGTDATDKPPPALIQVQVLVVCKAVLFFLLYFSFFTQNENRLLLAPPCGAPPYPARSDATTRCSVWKVLQNLWRPGPFFFIASSHHQQPVMKKVRVVHACGWIDRVILRLLFLYIVGLAPRCLKRIDTAHLLLVGRCIYKGSFIVEHGECTHDTTSQPSSTPVNRFPQRKEIRSARGYLSYHLRKNPKERLCFIE